MRTLRYKIALILIAAIVAVVVVATGVTAFVVSSGNSSRMMGPMAQHIAITGDVVTGAPAAQPRLPLEQIANSPIEGVVQPDLTEALQKALTELGRTGEVRVTENEEDGDPRVSYRLADGRWLIFDLPRPLGPPPQLWLALGGWLLLVVIGVAAVALITARRVTQPFDILERAVNSVGPDGVLPTIPETGSGEARHTAAVLNRLSDRLKAAMNSRMRLVAAAGHDLRTPMTRMRLRAEFLPDEERTSWLADLDELELIADSAIRLVREEGGGEDKVQVDLAALVAETVDELSASNLPVTLEAAEPGIVSAGPLALRRALRNLMTNAATHGGGARVTLAMVGQFAQIVIDDDGPGIPDDLMDHVFEPFFRAAPGRNRTVEGAGLGLAIAKEIVERFGGTVAIENRIGHGLRQTVTLNQVLR